MLYSLWTIGIASTIPGFGFWLMGQRHRGIVAGLVFLATLIFYGVSRLIFWTPLIEFAGYLVAFVWIAQAYFAVDTARLLKERIVSPYIKSNETQIVRLNFRDNDENRKLFFSQLNLDENLVAIITGNSHWYPRDKLSGIDVELPFQNFCMALTNQSILVVETDLLGIPMTFKRISQEQIKEVSLHKGIVIDEIHLVLRDSEKYKLKIWGPFREQGRAMANLLL